MLEIRCLKEKGRVNAAWTPKVVIHALCQAAVSSMALGLLRVRVKPLQNPIVDVAGNKAYYDDSCFKIRVRQGDNSNR